MNNLRHIKSVCCGLVFAAASIIPMLSFASDGPVYKYYSVYGRDFTSIEKSMMENRLNNANSSNEWHIGWKFSFQEYDDKCYLIKPTVSNETIVVLPQWDDIDQGEIKMQKEWKRYSKAVKLHQLGHVKFADQAQAAILSMLKSFQPLSSCAEVKKTANKKAKEILQKYYALDAAYEKETGEGATQGAQLKEP